MKQRRFSSALVLLSAAILGTVGMGLMLAACVDEPPLRRRTQTDTFFQEIRRTVDILLVVDNSCSMIDEQQKLAANFDNFISQFLDAEVDYQIGVVTTDMSDPEHQGRLVGETKIITSGMEVDVAISWSVDLEKEQEKICQVECQLESVNLDKGSDGFLEQFATIPY